MKKNHRVEKKKKMPRRNQKRRKKMLRKRRIPNLPRRSVSDGFQIKG